VLFKENGILLSDTSAKTKLQALLVHTIKHIFDKINNNFENNCNELRLLTKYNCYSSENLK
jgi:hypothetical protein